MIDYIALLVMSELKDFDRFLQNAEVFIVLHLLCANLSFS